MEDQHSDYRSFLLRLWRVGTGQGWVWRASLESPHTGERWHFASLADLFAFLRGQTGDEPQHQAHDETDLA